MLVKVHQLQRSMTTSPNDGDLRWRGTVRGMFYIILAGHSRLSLSLFVLSCGSHCIIGMSFICIIWPLCILAHIFTLPRVSFSSNRISLCPYSSFVLPLPLFITPTLIVTHHKHVGLVLSNICTTKLIIVYIMSRFAFFCSRLFVFTVCFVMGQ